jgi:hypothetical protein
MRNSVLYFCILLFVLVTVLNGGPSYGFGVGFVKENIYMDEEGFDESESGIPLLHCNLGYQINTKFIKFSLSSSMDFFCSDIIKGNRELTLFLKPSTLFSFPINLGKITFSPNFGYGGMYSKRYIKDRMYLQGEDRYINSANYENTTMDILVGAGLSYEDWFKPSLLFTKETSMFKHFSLQIRTPQCDKIAPYIDIAYTRGEKAKTFTISLVFYR